MALAKADGVVSYYTATFNSDGTVNMPSMEPFSYSLANAHANLVARTMCYDFMSGFSNSLILKSVDYALGHGVPPSKIQMAVDPSRTPVAQLDMLVNELAARKVGLAVMSVQRSTLARTAQWDAVLSPGQRVPGWPTIASRAVTDPSLVNHPGHQTIRVFVHATRDVPLYPSPMTTCRQVLKGRGSLVALAFQSFAVAGARRRWARDDLGRPAELGLHQPQGGLSGARAEQPEAVGGGAIAGAEGELLFGQGVGLPGACPLEHALERASRRRGGGALNLPARPSPGSGSGIDPRIVRPSCDLRQNG